MISKKLSGAQEGTRALKGAGNIHLYQSGLALAVFHRIPQIQVKPGTKENAFYTNVARVFGVGLETPPKPENAHVPAHSSPTFRSNSVSVNGATYQVAATPNQEKGAKTEAPGGVGAHRIGWPGTNEPTSAASRRTRFEPDRVHQFS